MGPELTNFCESKRKKKVLTLAQKVELLDKIEDLKSFATVGKIYGINESTVRYIYKNEKEIRNCFAASGSNSRKTVSHVHKKALNKMENALNVWMWEDQFCKAKRKKRVLTLAEKVEILDKIKDLKSFAAVGKMYGINESTVRYIYKKEKEIRSCFAVSSPKSMKFVARVRETALSKMERALSVCMENDIKKGLPINSTTVREKAKSLYNHYHKEQCGEGSSAESCTKTFTASKGWFERFKRRFSLGDLKAINNAVSADQEAATVFFEEFHKKLKEKEYMPEQVFNAGESGFYWKRMPNRSYITQELKWIPEFKASKDLVTLLFCANAAGDMIKPAMLCHSQNSRTLTEKDKNELPIYCQSNQKAWVTRESCVDWFNNCFVPEVEKYLTLKNLSFKVILILNNMPGHPEELKYLNKNIEVVFLPSNTTSLLQPLDQGIIRMFKVHYIKLFFRHIFNAMEENSNLGVLQSWKQFNIVDCIVTIKEALEELKQDSVNACWRKLWPQAVQNCINIPSAEQDIEEIVNMAHYIKGEGLSDMVLADVEELLLEPNYELTQEDLDEHILSLTDAEEKEDEEERGMNQWTLDSFEDIFKDFRNLKHKIQELDPLMERSAKIAGEIEQAFAPYTILYNEMKQNQQS